MKCHDLNKISVLRYELFLIYFNVKIFQLPLLNIFIFYEGYKLVILFHCGHLNFSGIYRVGWYSTVLQALGQALLKYTPQGILVPKFETRVKTEMT